METEIETQLKTWGNSFGIVIPRALASRLGLEAGTPIHVTIKHEPARNDAAHLPVWDFPYRPTKDVLDEAD